MSCPTAKTEFALIRNTKLVVSTISPGAGVFTAANSWEVPVLDGYSFSQDTATTEVTADEAGCTPIRGQRQFNDAVNAAQVSFATYMRPYDASGTKSAVEAILWSAYVNANSIAGSLDTYGAVGGTDANATNFHIDLERSNTNDLIQLQLYFNLDGAYYHIEDVMLDTVSSSYDIQGIAQIDWAGQGSNINRVSDVTTLPFGGSNVYKVASSLNAEFIRNKLSTVSLNAYQPSHTVIPVTSSTLDKADLAYSSAGSGTYGNRITVARPNGQSTVFDVTLAATDTTTTIGDVIDAFNQTVKTAYAFINSDERISVVSLERGTTATVKIDESAATLTTIGATAGGLFKDLDVYDGTFTYTGRTGTGAYDQIHYDINESSLNYEPSITGTDDPDIDGTPVAIAGAKGIEDPSSAYNATTNPANKEYDIALTGGSFELANNLNFLIPEELGIVNTAIGGFAGTRAVTGTLNCYLKAGDAKSAGLLGDLAANVDRVVNCHYLKVSIGGCNTSPRVDAIFPYCNIVIPTIETQDILSTSIAFTALGSELTEANEMITEYYSS